MANFWYRNALSLLMKGDVDLENDDIRVVLCTASYAPSRTADDFLNDISAGYRVSTSGNLTSKVVANAVLDAADVTFTSLTGSVVRYIVLYKHTGVESTSPLLICIDTASNLPLTPDGTNYTLAWAAAGIASLESNS